MMLFSLLLTLFALAPISRYDPALPAVLLDVTSQGTIAETTPATANASMSWKPYARTEQLLPTVGVSLTSIARSFVTTTVGAAHDTYHAAVDLLCTLGLYCHPSTMAFRFSPGRNSAKLAPCPTKTIRSTIRSPSPTRTYPSRGSTDLCLGSLRHLALAPVHRLLSLHYSARNWSVFALWQPGRDKPVPIPRSGPPPNTCTLPDLSKCGVGALYLEPIEVMIDYRPSYTPWVEVTLGALTLAVLVVAALVYTGVLAGLWWMTRCIAYVLMVVVSAAVKLACLVCSLVSLVGQMVERLFVTAVRLSRRVYLLYGHTTAVPNPEFTKRCYHDIVASARSAPSTHVLNLSIPSKHSTTVANDRSTRWIPGPFRPIDPPLQSDVPKNAPVELVPAGTRETKSPATVPAPAPISSGPPAPARSIPTTYLSDSEEVWFTDASSVSPASTYSTSLGEALLQTLAARPRTKKRARMKVLRPLEAREYEADNELDDYEDEGGCRVTAPSIPPARLVHSEATQLEATISVSPLRAESIHNGTVAAASKHLSQPDRSLVSCDRSLFVRRRTHSAPAYLSLFNPDCEAGSRRDLGLQAESQTITINGTINGYVSSDTLVIGLSGGRGSNDESSFTTTPTQLLDLGHETEDQDTNHVADSSLNEPVESTPAPASNVELLATCDNNEAIDSTPAALFAPSDTDEVRTNGFVVGEWDSSIDTVVPATVISRIVEKSEPETKSTQPQDGAEAQEFPEHVFGPDGDTVSVGESSNDDGEESSEESDDEEFVGRMCKMLNSATPTAEPAYIDPDTAHSVSSSLPCAAATIPPSAAPNLTPQCRDHEPRPLIPSVLVTPPTSPAPVRPKSLTHQSTPLPASLIALINAPTSAAPSNQTSAATLAKAIVPIPPKPILNSAQRNRMLDALEEEEAEEGTSRSSGSLGDRWRRRL